MNPENNVGDNFQNNGINSSSLGSLQDVALNNMPVQEPVNPTLNDINNVGIQNPQSSVLPQSEGQVTSSDFYNAQQPIQNEVETLGNVINNYEPVQNQEPLIQAAPVEPSPAMTDASNFNQSFEQSSNLSQYPNELGNQPVVEEAPYINPSNDIYAGGNVQQNLQQVENSQPEFNQVTQPQMPVDSAQTGPTLPIPDVMPDLGYQSAVSTPVDYATPMTNFDEIGETPELDPKAKGNKKSGKTLVFLLLMLLIIGLGAGSYYLINVKKIFDKSSVVTKNLTIEQGSVLPDDINEYATFKNMASSNCVNDVSQVQVDKIGTYNYLIKCGKNEYKGTVTIKDTTAPSVKLNAKVVKVGDANITADSLISSCSEENCTYSIAEGQDIADIVSSKGIKSVKITATDASGNTANIVAPIIVIEENLHFGLIATKQLVSGDEYTVNEKNVILYSDLTYLAYTMYEIKFNDASVYETYLKTSTDTSAVTIGNYSGIGIFNEEENKIILVSSEANNLIQGDYQLDRQALLGVDYEFTLFASDHLEVLNY